MIREAIQSDVKDILKIYNHSILEGTASFEEVPLTIEEGREWISSHKGNYPLYVLENQGEVIGFVCLSPFGKSRETAYRLSAEISIYVDKDARGIGAGKQLMSKICDFAKKNEVIKTVISVITDGNVESINLHEKFGFTFGGKLTKVAQKHEETLDVLFYQRTFE